MGEEQPVDVLIQWVPKGTGVRVEPAPGHSAAKDFDFLMRRFRSTRPMAPDAADRYVAKIHTGEPQPELLYKLGYGACLMADRIKAIFDEFRCPGLEYIPVDSFKVSRESDFLEEGIRGEPVAEPFWIMNCYNFHSAMDEERSVGRWRSHRPYDLESIPDFYSADDPPELYNPQRIALDRVPDDAMFGIFGLSEQRFVSEQLFDRIVTSGLFDPRWELPFTIFNLLAEERGTGGYAHGTPIDERRPLRLNGRTLYWGNLRQPLDFPPDGVWQS